MSTVLRLSIVEYHGMIERGAFEGLRGKNIELVHGELRNMSPQGPWHSEGVDFIARWSFDNLAASEARVRVQEPVTFLDSDSEPEPDIVWAKPKRYRDGHPEADDVLLLVEVALSTLSACLGERADLFAAAGIQDYWVIDLEHRSVHVLRDPQNGEYQSRQECTSGSVASLAFPQVALSLAELFAE